MAGKLSVTAVSSWPSAARQCRESNGRNAAQRLLTPATATPAQGPLQPAETWLRDRNWEVPAFAAHFANLRNSGLRFSFSAFTPSRDSSVS
jgi:hypothetical protein